MIIFAVKGEAKMKRVFSGIMLALILISMLTLAFNIRPVKAWTGTIYIRADGSIDPPDAPVVTYDKIVYRLTGDISSSASGIVVQRNNIIIDGAGYTVVGNRELFRYGISLVERINVTIKNLHIKNFWDGIYLYSSSNNIISENSITGNIDDNGIYLLSSSNNIIRGNSITNNRWGIYVRDSSNNIISENEITKNSDDGIYLYSSSNYNSISGNIIASNDVGIYLYSSSNNIISGNSIGNNGLGVGLYESLNNSVRRNSIGYNSGCGIDLRYDSNYNIISENGIANNSVGIHVYYSSNNIISGNEITNSGDYGIHVDSGGYELFYRSSNNNIISGNEITNSGDYGIYLYSSSNNNKISKNNITNNRKYGIYLYSSSKNIISENSITNNGDYGIYLYSSSNNNKISKNNITNNVNYGAFLYYSSNNVIYHNNFINNPWQIYSGPPGYANVLDDGYPSGGNFWSDYAGVDLYCGPYQNEIGSDGIGDTPYITNANNTDRYSLMAPFTTFGVEHSGSPYEIDVVTNSSILDFEINESLIPEIPSTISFNLSGPEGAKGFCKITIPNTIVNDFWHGNYTVLLNDETWPFKNWTDAESTYIYINYTHSTHQIVIIPEFPATTLLPLLMVLSLLSIVIKKRRCLKSQKSKR